MRAKRVAKGVVEGFLVGAMIAVVLAVVVLAALPIFVVAAFLFDGLLGYHPTMKDVVLSLFVLAAYGWA